MNTPTEGLMAESSPLCILAEGKGQSYSTYSLYAVKTKQMLWMTIVSGTVVIN